jgi:hypothetical protein
MHRPPSMPAVQELPPSSGAPHPSSELDGLAAFLAARIRTKAELKQVCYVSKSA